MTKSEEAIIAAAKDLQLAVNLGKPLSPEVTIELIKILTEISDNL